MFKFIEFVKTFKHLVQITRQCTIDSKSTAKNLLVWKSVYRNQISKFKTSFLNISTSSSNSERTYRVDKILSYFSYLYTPLEIVLELGIFSKKRMFVKNRNKRWQCPKRQDTKSAWQKTRNQPQQQVKLIYSLTMSNLESCLSDEKLHPKKPDI